MKVWVWLLKIVNTRVVMIALHELMLYVLLGFCFGSAEVKPAAVSKFSLSFSLHANLHDAPCVAIVTHCAAVGVQDR